MNLKKIFIFYFFFINELNNLPKRIFKKLIVSHKVQIIKILIFGFYLLQTIFFFQKIWFKLTFLCPKHTVIFWFKIFIFSFWLDLLSEKNPNFLSKILTSLLWLVFSDNPNKL